MRAGWKVWCVGAKEKSVTYENFTDIYVTEPFFFFFKNSLFYGTA